LIEGTRMFHQQGHDCGARNASKGACHCSDAGSIRLPHEQSPFQPSDRRISCLPLIWSLPLLRQMQLPQRRAHQVLFPFSSAPHSRLPLGSDFDILASYHIRMALILHHKTRILNMGSSSWSRTKCKANDDICPTPHKVLQLSFERKLETNTSTISDQDEPPTPSLCRILAARTRLAHSCYEQKWIMFEGGDRRS
jgi:hypothetical protein